jgi:hypothetical protein
VKATGTNYSALGVNGNHELLDALKEGDKVVVK